MDDTAATIIEESGQLLHALLMAAVVLVIFFIVGMVVLKKVLPGLQKKLEDKHLVVFTLVKGFRQPLSFYFKVAGFLSVLLTFIYFAPVDLFPNFVAALFVWLPPALTTLLRIITVVTVAWGLVASSEITSFALKNARNKLDLNLSKGITRFLSAIFNVLIIVLAAAIVLSELGYDINGLVAGVGLGGLTIALAAQNVASNFFGGLVIVMEKPFEIGDWISCTVVEGTVEDINLRSTRIRTSSGAITVVPNSTLSDAALTNWTATMKRRRASLTVNVTYDTSREDMKCFADAVRTLLETDPEILPDGLLVRFSELGASSLNLLVVFNTSLPGYADHMRIKERVNYGIMELAEQYGVCFAFPTSTVQLQDARPE